MLYTLSKAQYDVQELATILAQIRPTDALLLWQDGVLQAVKNPQLFTNIDHVFALKNDVQARSLPLTIPQLSLAEVVKLTEDYAPHVAL